MTKHQKVMAGIEMRIQKLEAALKKARASLVIVRSLYDSIEAKEAIAKIDEVLK